MGNYVYNHRPLDPGPRKPDGTRRSMREREHAICEALKAQGRVKPNGHLTRPDNTARSPKKPDPLI